MSEHRTPIVPWSGRGMKYTEEEIQAVCNLMNEIDPLTQGSYQSKFEEDLSQFTQSKHCFAVSTGTAALELAAILCQLTQDDEVIIPAHTFAATAIPFARTGAKINWADINPRTFLSEAEQFEKLITPRTKAIVVVHLYGLPVNMEQIQSLANAHNLLVIEDAAQAIGGTFKSTPVGGLGDFGCFSFHTHKNITTLGEGGALTVRSPNHAKLVPGLRHNGMRPYARQGEDYWVPAMTNVDLDIDGVWPYNFCMSEIQCALGSLLLKRVDELNNKRKQRAHYISSKLVAYPEIQFQQMPADRKSAYHLLPARIQFGEKSLRDEFMRLMFHEYGVRTVVQYYPLYRYPMFTKMGLSTASCPHTDQFFDNMVSFPFHHWLSDSQIDHMIDSIKKSVSALRKKGD